MILVKKEAVMYNTYKNIESKTINFIYIENKYRNEYTRANSRKRELGG